MLKRRIGIHAAPAELSSSFARDGYKHWAPTEPSLLSCSVQSNRNRLGQAFNRERKILWR